MRTISLKLPDNLLKLLEKESRTRRTTKSSVVRACLEKGLTARASGREATCYDLARDLAGSVKGLPGDVANDHGQLLRVIKLEPHKEGRFMEGLRRLGRVPAGPRDKSPVKPLEKG